MIMETGDRGSVPNWTMKGNHLTYTTTHSRRHSEYRLSRPSLKNDHTSLLCERREIEKGR